VARALALVAIALCFIFYFPHQYVNNWRTPVVTKDLLIYNIKREQDIINHHQAKLALLIEALELDNPEMIDLTSIELPFDQQPKNHVKNLPDYLKGQPLRASNFDCYDIRRIRKLPILSISKAPYQCEVVYEDCYQIIFEDNIKMNVYGNIVHIAELLNLAIDHNANMSTDKGFVLLTTMRRIAFNSK
jgi:hypothetical protein